MYVKDRMMGLGNTCLYMYIIIYIHISLFDACQLLCADILLGSWDA